MRKSRIILVEIGLAVLLNITAGLLQRPIAIALAKAGWWILILTIIYFIASDDRIWPRIKPPISRMLGSWAWAAIGIVATGAAVGLWISVSRACDHLFAELPNSPQTLGAGFLQLGYTQFVTQRVVAGGRISLNVSIANKGGTIVEEAYPFWAMNLVPVDAPNAVLDERVHKGFVRDALKYQSDQITNGFKGVSVGVGHGVWNTLTLPEVQDMPLSIEQVNAFLKGSYRLYVYVWARWRGAARDLDFCEWMQKPTSDQLSDKNAIWHLCSSAVEAH